MKIKAGDVVVLLSGGPLMTVHSCGEKVMCYWFDGTELKKAYFTDPQLKLSDKPEA